MKKILSCMFVMLCLTCFLFQGCSPSKLVYINGKKWIPADFDPASTILIVQQLPRPGKEMQRMEEFMHEKYPYRYEFVPIETIKSREGKYADTKLYKYALIFSYGLNNTSPGSVKFPSFPEMLFDMRFYDRGSGKKLRATNYPLRSPSSVLKPVINTIVKKYQ